MKIPSLMVVVLCALPLFAHLPSPHRSHAAAPEAGYATRVVVPCELTSSSLSLTGEENPQQGRGFSLHVVNNSARTLAIPTAPDFGWRVETLKKKRWMLKAEGGPVRRLRSNDPHLVVDSHPVSGPMLELAPSQAHDFTFFLPEADPALRPDAGVQSTTLKLTVYWAATAVLARSNPGVPPCALAADWVVSMQPN